MLHIDAAISADDNYGLPLLLKAWMLHGARDEKYNSEITTLMNAAEARLPAVQDRDYSVLSALKLARSGKVIECATALEKVLIASPTDLLVHQLAQEEIFWIGRPVWMRNITERAAPAWRETSADFGHFLSLRSFACEEAGYLEDAEQFGRMAVEIDPADVWGAHAVAHVLIMRGEIHKGIDWLESLSMNWGHANQMRHHLWWHVCLFLLELGQYDRILELLTTEIRNPQSALVKASPAATIDITNFASLLMRLELYGVDVGDHWHMLSNVCADRVNNHGNAFSNIHDMMVLTATGNYEHANDLLTSMKNRYDGKLGSVAHSYSAAGIPVCQAVLDHRKKNYSGVLERLGGARHHLLLLGASHAQRDVFYHLLFHAAQQEGRDDLCAIYRREIEHIGFCEVPDRAAYKYSAGTHRPVSH